MKTDVITVSSKGLGLDEALAQAGKVAEYKRLAPVDALHLRLLAEEMMSMVSSIIGDLEGKFWIEEENGEYRLHLSTVTLLDSRQRTQLVSASTSRRNEARLGIMGKIRAFFEPLPIEETPAYLLDAIDVDSKSGDLTWSLEAYRQRIRKREDAGAQADWDALERSVVSHIADNIQVSIRGYDLELVILKRF